MMDDGIVYYNHQREVKLFLPPHPTQQPSPAVIILPGGAYYKLSTRYEGSEVAHWFNTMGIAAAVLHYRMPDHHPEVPQEDILATLMDLRAQAEQWHIDPQRIGIIGFSAGGHAVSLALTRQLSFRCAILFYPVITMDKKQTHGETHDWLLSADATKEQEQAYSAQQHVKADLPPTLLIACEDDDLVPVSNSQCFYEELQRQGVPSCLHILSHGGHGWGWSEAMPQREQVLTIVQQFIQDQLL